MISSTLILGLKLLGVAGGDEAVEVSGPWQSSSTDSQPSGCPGLWVSVCFHWLIAISEEDTHDSPIL